MAMPQSSWPEGRKHFWSSIPVTKVVIGLMLVSFLGIIVTRGVLFDLLVYLPFKIPNGIIGLFSHPFAFMGAQDIINLLISGVMLWMFGGSLERSWGPRLYIAFLALASAIGALVWTVGAWLFGAVGAIAGPWMLISAVIVAWAWLNPEETILFWFVLPLKAKWIGWLDIVLLFFLFPVSHGAGDARLFILGFFALGGVAVAYAFARYHRDWAWILRPHNREKANRRVLRHPSSTFFGALTRPWREWQRRRRISYLQKTIRFEEEDQAK